MEGVWVVSWQNADTANTLHLMDVAMAITFWLLMGYNFGCMIANNLLFDSTLCLKKSSHLLTVCNFVKS